MTNPDTHALSLEASTGFARARIGLIIPSSNRLSEPQFRRFLPADIAVHVTRLRMTGKHRKPLEDLLRDVEDAAGALGDAKCDSIVFHCTANSMEHGPEGEKRILDTVAAASGARTQWAGLFAAGAVGVIVAQRATFAAEVAGCQVEIGAAGAMAAAAVVDAMGGSAAQACSAAAISFQNTMGSVCDLVQGMVEIPCHTRNAVAAANAFLVADLVLGGYRNPVPLDETIDAVFDVGRMMPSELRCTSGGGLAMAPSARALKAKPCLGCGS